MLFHALGRPKWSMALLAKSRSRRSRPPRAVVRPATSAPDSIAVLTKMATVPATNAGISRERLFHNQNFIKSLASVIGPE